jgi:uncharacterized protein (TIGR03118 family)
MLFRIVRRGTFLAVVAAFASTSLFAQHYQRKDLTTNSPAVSASAANIDPNLVNAWGLARGSGTPWWISDNGTSLTTLYDGSGVPQQLVVKIPAPDPNGTSAPTGAVFNPTTGFQIKAGAKALFIFATEDGTIAAWNPTVDLNNAVLMVKRTGQAIYKGIAIAQVAGSPRLYATNFQTGRVEVFASNFGRISTAATAFAYPGLSAAYSPFNIQNVGGNLVITFAHRKPGSTDEDHGAGLGFVGVFDPVGHLLFTLSHGPWFNAPWGIALAPGDFGAFSHRLLIGNFGDGTVHAFNLFTGKHEGALLDAASGGPLTIDGLWALGFGGDAQNNGVATSLFFTAGPNDEADGLYGQVTPVTAEQPGNSQ